MSARARSKEEIATQVSMKKNIGKSEDPGTATIGLTVCLSPAGIHSIYLAGGKGCMYLVLYQQMKWDCGLGGLYVQMPATKESVIQG